MDSRKDTLNIDEVSTDPLDTSGHCPLTMMVQTKIEAAITPNTKVICVVHYAGVPCEMDAIMDIAKRHNLIVIEDAAQVFWLLLCFCCAV